MPKQVVEKHPLAVRWLHWINFPLLLIMLYSGLLIYWANAVYNVRIGDKVLFHFFPKPFFEALDVPYKLAYGLGLHFTFMWPFALNGLVYTIYVFSTRHRRDLLPRLRDYGQAVLVFLATLGLRRKPQQHGKYNAAQKIAYTSTVVMGWLMIISGLAIYKPAQLNWLTSLCGGYGNARFIHFMVSVAFVLFLLVHVLQVIRAGWRNFSSMVTGLEVVKTTGESGPKTEKS